MYKKARKLRFLDSHRLKFTEKNRTLRKTKFSGGKTALMLAAYHGHNHVITTLMELGCDWQKLDNAGCTGQCISTIYNLFS